MTGAALLVTTLSLVGGPSAAGAGTGSWRKCPGAVSVTNPATAKAIASDITIHGKIGCPTAKQAIRAFLKKELQGNLRCAEAANNPPYKGCHVGSFTCRSSASLRNAKGCADAGERVDFRGRQIPLG